MVGASLHTMAPVSADGMVSCSSIASGTMLATRVDVAGRTWLGVSTSALGILWVPTCVVTLISCGSVPYALALTSVCVSLLTLARALTAESATVDQTGSDSASYAWLLLCEVIAFSGVYTCIGNVIGHSARATAGSYVSVSTLMASLSLCILLVVTLLIEYSSRLTSTGRVA